MTLTAPVETTAIVSCDEPGCRWYTERLSDVLGVQLAMDHARRWGHLVTITR